MEERRKPEYYSFLLRLWQVENGDQRKRASLENVESGEKLGFASLKELLVYLSELTLAWEKPPDDGN